MTNLRRFLWGGVGGLAPILATFLILEGDIIGRYLKEWSSGGDALTMIGYAVRVIGLFIVGGLWASLHKSERDPKKLFQLGIVAPAMITGMISASNVSAAIEPPAPASGTERPEAARVAPAPSAPATARRVAPAPGATATADMAPTTRAPAVTGGQSSSRSVTQNQQQQPPPDPEPVKSFIRGLLGRP